MTETKPSNPYERRKNRIDRKDYAKLNNKWVQAQSSRVAAGKIDRSKLWEGLNAYVMKHTSFITSPAHSYPVRLETPLDSKLPEKLRELGYIVLDKGIETRIGGPASPEYEARWRRRAITGGYGQYTVAIHELDLPKRRSDPTGKAAIPVQ